MANLSQKHEIDKINFETLNFLWVAWIEHGGEGLGGFMDVMHVLCWYMNAVEMRVCRLWREVVTAEKQVSVQAAEMSNCLPVWLAGEVINKTPEIL